jgi:hypothetical protein
MEDRLTAKGEKEGLEAKKKKKNWADFAKV